MSQSSQAFATDIQARIGDVLAFAEAIDYQHSNQSKELYLAHPFRVAQLSIAIPDAPDVHLTSLALVHNIMEVTSIPHSQIAERLGEVMTAEIKVLTVDRSNQTPQYKKSYYAGIAACSVATRSIKAFDKLDNLFLLCLNPDAEVRAKYLLEIEDYVIPMAVEDVPQLEKYFRQLVEDCRNLGHVKL